ncbi:MAG: RagB/SusD family nutrient uptake outer membrane protein [Mangrovibacterium sp.]
MKSFKLFFFSAIFLLGGCMDLNEVPEGILSPENYYSSVAQVEAVLASSMDCVWTGWSAYRYAWQYFQNDDQLHGGNLVISYNHGTELWNAHYAALLNLNMALRAIDSGSLTDASQEQVDLLVGQIKLVRGWNYFMLVRMYGGVPLYLEDDNPGLNPEARASIEDVYASVISDFTDAIAKLPDTWPDNQQGRPTKGTAKGLLAKSYLAMATAPLNKIENYAKAAELAKDVMDDGVYSLEPNVGDVFKEENKYGPEILWSFNSTKDDGSVCPQIWGPGVEPYWGWSDYTVDLHYDSIYPVQPRRDAYMLREVNGVPYTEFEYNKRPSIRKMLYMDIDEYNTWVSEANLPILRYADILLIFAEAENMSKGGPTQAAVDAVNAVIDRANGHALNEEDPLLTISMSKTEFDDAVIDQRNWELCFEYDRWFDICRKRILDKVTYWPQYKVNFSEDDYLFPIPEPDLRLNPLLEQNPGYPTPER